MEEVTFIEHLTADSELHGPETRRGNTAALAVTTVVHLHRGSVNVPAGNLLSTAEPDDTTAALLLVLLFRHGETGVRTKLRSCL
jgi:hypothetical protein